MSNRKWMENKIDPKNCFHAFTDWGKFLGKFFSLSLSFSFSHSLYLLFLVYFERKVSRMVWPEGERKVRERVLRLEPVQDRIQVVQSEGWTEGLKTRNRGRWRRGRKRRRGRRRERQSTKEEKRVAEGQGMKVTLLSPLFLSNILSFLSRRIFRLIRERKDWNNCRSKWWSCQEKAGKGWCSCVTILDTSDQISPVLGFGLVVTFTSPPFSPPFSPLTGVGINSSCLSFLIPHILFPTLTFFFFFPFTFFFLLSFCYL